MQIREAKTSDCAAIAQVQVDSYRSAYASIFPQAYLAHFTHEEQEQDWRNLLSSGSRDILCVAETDASEIVGYALGQPGPTEVAPYDSELVALHVRRAHQRHGIGRRLIADMAERLRRHGCASLMLWVLGPNPARAFYEQLGGQYLGIKPWCNNDEFKLNVVEAAYGWLDIKILCAP